ncbi:LCP family protein [Cryobacterium sp. TMT3-29-2]|uniref:LCP family protein n=1 Tax=Cryobacterium sp. TMT3-29-2 TaxID=2555867 RepID=UPI00143017B4|nr:LCP family protein [Cryobacterium sp. TMT3-29-2]
MEPDRQPGAQVSARHTSGTAQHRRRSRWRSVGLPVARFTLISLAVLLVSATALATVFVNQVSQRVTGNAVDISNGRTDGEQVRAAPAGVPEFDGGFTILMVGVDNAGNQSAAFGWRESTLNDVNILLHVADDHESAVVVSFPRDLVIPQPACTDADTGTVSAAASALPINGSFGRGGLGCVVDTVQRLTGLPIPYAGVISFEGTVAMADAVGGVPICLTEAIDDPYTGLDLPAGVSVVSGQTALSYLRSRHGVGDGSDLARISSQQAYLSSLVRVLASDSTLTDLPKLSGLATTAATNLRLSESLAGIPTMVSMALVLREIDLDRLLFVQYPALPNPADLAKLVPDPVLAGRLFTKIRAGESFALAPGSLGDSVEPTPGTALEGAPVAEATLPATATATPTPVPPSTPDPGPEVIEGLRGQTAGQQTCSVAYGG